MKTYSVKIKPLTGFGDFIKGDTLFGHICWQLCYDPKIFGKSLDELLNDYDKNPFIVLSSAYPVVNNKIYLKRPALPLSMLFDISEEEIVKNRKELKRRNYFAFEQPLNLLRKINYESLSFFKEQEQTRCSINRLTNTTTEPPFAPYNVGKIFFNCNLVVFAGLRDDININSFLEILSRIGKHGYGKDATVGYGKFDIISWEEIDLLNTAKSPNALYTLSPLCPDSAQTEKIYFNPFVRFGRHGDILSKSKNPFKNPVIFADEAAIVFTKAEIIKPYIGKVVRDISKALPEAVTQGYSLVIKVEV